MKRQSHEYSEGRRLAQGTCRLTAGNRTRLRVDSEFWQGFHDWRPYACFAPGITLEDPTRPAGWCTVKSIPTEESR